MSMRVMSLDFDGVTHPAQEKLDPALHFCWLPVLEKLLAPHPDVVLTVHSTWRYNHQPWELKELLGALGSRLVGVAPRGGREDSVLWLMKLLGDVEDFLVLDDDKKAFKELTAPRLLITHPAEGVSSQATQQSIRTWLAGA